MTRLAWSRSHGEPEEIETMVIPMRSGDPPSVAAATAGPGANGEAVVSGGATAESLPDGTTLWDLVVGDEGSIASGVAAGLQQIAEQPGRLASARLKALAELQAVLRSHSNGIDWEQSIHVPAGDLVLVLQLAMQRLQ